MGIEGRGDTLEEAFAQAATAMFGLMVDVKRVRPRRKVSLVCRGNDRAELFIEWLNGLLAMADIRRMAFSRFQVSSLSGNRLEGSAWGESFDPLRHNPKTEVKAATYSMLTVDDDVEGDQFVARCVVDL